MWCGPKSCRAVKARSLCPAGQSCVPIKEEHCFVKPCPSLGECWPPAPPPPSKCHASFSYQNNSCANITFTFNKENMPQVSHTFSGERLNYELLSCFPPFSKRLLHPSLILWRNESTVGCERSGSLHLGDNVTHGWIFPCWLDSHKLCCHIQTLFLQMNKSALNTFCTISYDSISLSEPRHSWANIP